MALPSRSKPGDLLARTLLVCVVAFAAGTSAAWVYLNRAPPAWDDAAYLADSLRMYDALREGGLVAYARAFQSAQSGLRTPLLCALPTPIYLMLGRDWKLAYGVNLLFAINLLVCVYVLGRRWGGAAAGVVAAAIVATMPLLYGLSHAFLVEYGLTSLTALCICLLTDERTFRSTGRAAVLGTLIGLGVLMKVFFPLYLLPLLVVAVVRGRRGTDRTPPARLHVVAALLFPAILLPLPWVVAHAPTLFGHAVRSGFSAESERYGTANPFSAAAVAGYLLRMTNLGVSVYYAALAVVVGAVLLARRVTRGGGAIAAGTGCAWLLAWAAPVVVLLVSRNQGPRFAAPLLPAFAIALALGMVRVVGRSRWRGVILALLLVFPAFAMVAGSFGKTQWAVGPFKLVGAGGVAGAYDPTPWPLDAAVRWCAPVPSGRTGQVLVCANSRRFNFLNLDLAAAQARVPLQFWIAGTAGTAGTDADAVGQLKEADFAVDVEGGEPPQAGTALHREAIRGALAGAGFVLTPGGVALPGGGVARVYRRAVAR